MRQIMVYAGMLLLTIAAGLVVRFAPLGLPGVVSKYGGSMLWALAIYWVVAMSLRTWRPVRVMLVAGAVSTAVEFLKLYRVGWLDAFRLTLPGVLLLGRYFAWADIAAYWVAIGTGAIVDGFLIRSRVRSDPRGRAA